MEDGEKKTCIKDDDAFCFSLSLKKIYNKIKKIPNSIYVSEYEIITFTSGQILDEKEVRILAYKMKELNKYINIKSKVIYYDIGEDVSINDSIITCGLIKLISRVQPKDVLPLQLDMNDSDEVNIKKIIGYIQSDN